MWRKGKTTTHLTPSQSQRKYVVSSWSLAYVVASVWQTWFVQSIDSLSSGAHWYPYLKTKSFILVFWIWLASHPWKQYQLVLKEFVCWYEEKLRELITRKSWTHCLIPIHFLRADFHNFWKQKQWKWKCTLGMLFPLLDCVISPGSVSVRAHFIRRHWKKSKGNLLISYCVCWEKNEKVKVK